MKRTVFALGLGALLCGTMAMAKDAKAPQKASPGAPPAASAGTSPQGLGSGDGPLQVYADNGMELSQDAKLLIARGNAKAIRGTMTVTGDTLIAHYRPKPTPEGQPAPKPKEKDAASGSDPTGGGSEVWRVEADGHVTIASPTQTAYGDHADYNIDDAVVVLTGKDLRLVTPTDVITAKDSLEYWDQRHQAVARGEAVAVRNEKRIQADVLVADFVENEQKQMNIQVAHGYGHVILTTPTEVVTGDRSDYLTDTGIVTITGAVKMTRGDNQLNGGYAVINLNTGVSHVYPAPPGKSQEGQVKGLLVPQKGKAAPAPVSPPAPAPAAAVPPNRNP